jgi:hypothetical protein
MFLSLVFEGSDCPADCAKAMNATEMHAGDAAADKKSPIAVALLHLPVLPLLHFIFTFTLLHLTLPP